MASYIQSGMEHIGEILSGQKKYTVPPNQRDYSWTEDEVEQLWLDVKEAITEGSHEYFLGSIVLQKSSEGNEFTVIDGQQRIATTLLMIAAIRNIYKSQNDDRHEDLQNAYFGTKDRTTREIIPKVELNEINNLAFKKYIVNYSSREERNAALKDKLTSQSNRLLVNGLNRLEDLISSYIGLGESEFKHEMLIEIEDYLQTKAVVLQISVSDEADAYTIFETLNDRGLDLSTIDLLKNHIFGRAKTKLNIVKSDWVAMRENLGEENEKAFLRHYWVARKGRVRATHLFRKIRADLTDVTSTVQFVDGLKKSAKVYAALSNADHAFWTEYSDYTKAHIEGIKILGATQSYPILLAAAEVVEPTDFEKIAWLMLVMAVRYSLIGGYSPSTLENVYSDIAPKIHKREIKTAMAMYNQLNGTYKVYPSDDVFKQDFAHKSIRKAAVARFILKSLNDALQPGGLEASANTKKVNLEHIAPRNRNADWTKLEKAHDFSWDDYLYRIGNLTLSETPGNKDAGNKPFADKLKELYAKSEIKLTSDLTTHSSWLPDNIIARQEELATVAAALWKFPK